MKPLDNVASWPDMYVYESHVFRDLLEAVEEYVGECEHDGSVANCHEISTATVTDMEAFCEKRKALLLKDFVDYIQVTLE